MFFSTQYCESVKDFQCVLHNESVTESCTNVEQKLRSLEQALAKEKQDCNARSTSVTDANTANRGQTTALIVMCVIFFLFAVVLFAFSLRLWFRLRLRRSIYVDKSVELK